MPAYQIKNGKAERIKQVEFSNESELHLLIDSNLEEMFGIKYMPHPALEWVPQYVVVNVFQG